MTRPEHVDAVVVGSGFGGAVSAYRLADAGWSVLVLERGKAYPPGSFARSPHEMAQAFWEPKDDLYGLFDIRSFRHLEAVVSSGLGGGSLIYANVLLRKDEQWFVRSDPLPHGGYEDWPVTRADLDPHYDAVEAMLTPVPSPYPDLPKAQALRAAAERVGLATFAPPLAVSFAPTPDGEPGPKQFIAPPMYGNLHGVPRMTCRLCGECDVGCNDGAKNTMDHTYLSAAVARGADLRTLSEVKGIAPAAGGGYDVRYVSYGEADEDGRRSSTPHRVHCDRLLLGAGALGTTELLLRNRVALPALGPALGTRFSGNGDLMTFIVNARKESRDGRWRVVDASRGPVITTAIRVPEQTGDGADPGMRGFYIQEAGFPLFANWLVETTQVASVAARSVQVARALLDYRLRRRNESTISAEIARLIGQGRFTSSGLPLLGMGRDVPDGRIVLTDGELDVWWTPSTSEAYFATMRATMRRLADALYAGFSDNPLWWARRLITVHPVGGVPMGEEVRTGVCDSYGESFGHPGLWVVDGAVMPGPVGPNPALTIAAMADRAAERMISRTPRSTAVGWSRTDRGDEPDDGEPDGQENGVGGPIGRSVRFTERMKGHLTLGATDPRDGWRAGRLGRTPFMFELTITVPDIDRFLADDTHLGSADGFIRYQPLGGQLPVERGWFKLFVPGADALTREMRYRLWFSDLGGNPVTMVGVKYVRDDPGADLWRDTSTLYVRLFRGHLPPGEVDEVPDEVAGAGLLRILPRDFARQLTTFRADGRRPITAVGAFGRYFVGSLREVYLRPRRRARVPSGAAR